MDDLLSVGDVARLLRVTNATVLRIVREGKLPAVRIGRTYRVEAGKLEEWLAAGGEKRQR